MGEAPARLVGRPRRSAGPVLRGRPNYGEKSEHKLGPNDAATKQAQALDHAPAGQGSETTSSPAAEDGHLLHTGRSRGDNLSNTDDQGVPDPGGRHADCRPLVRHRAALRLLLHRDVVRQRRDVDPDQYEPLGAGLRGPRQLQRQRHRHRGLERRRLHLVDTSSPLPSGSPRSACATRRTRTPAERVS